MVYYLNPINSGLKSADSRGDGYEICLTWWQAYPNTSTNSIAYNIYYSTIEEDLLKEGPKFISIDDSLDANIINLTPGQEYFFLIRPIEYNSLIYNLSLLPIAYENIRYYPISVLSSDINLSTLSVPVLDVSEFPSTGIIKVGVELMNYSSINLTSNIFNISQRGYFNSKIRYHNVDGYDGYDKQSTIVSYYIYGESNIFDNIIVCQSRFNYSNYAFTIADGYAQVTKDILSTDLSASDTANTGFPAYSYSGWHRIDPVLLINGTCVGSYQGGEYGCIDGYGNNMQLRGLNLQDKNNQRQEMLLNETGRVACLIRKQQTGIICSCYQPSNEYADDRCPSCYGTKFVFGYEQIFYDRRSDGRLLVRMYPTIELLKPFDSGNESELGPTTKFWTLTNPSIKTRDIIVLFDIDDNEEFRYEVTQVSRNNTYLGQEGAQIFDAIRVRKTDPIYQIRIFRDTAMYPTNLDTGLTMAVGIGLHKHTIRVNEQIDISKFSQTTSIDMGHSHPVYYDHITHSLKVYEALGHTHTIVIV